MRFTLPLLAALGVASAAGSAALYAQAPDTLAQEYQQALRDSGRSSPSFRDAKTDAERAKAVEAMGAFAGRFVKLAEKHPNDPLVLEVVTQAVRTMNALD